MTVKMGLSEPEVQLNEVLEAEEKARNDLDTAWNRYMGLLAGLFAIFVIEVLR